MVDQYLREGCGRCPLVGTPQCKVHHWNDILVKLREIIQQTTLKEEYKWKQPCYTYNNIFFEKEIYSYITEGIGEDILPANVDFDLIDHFEKVTDKEGALVTRELARKEGLFLGYSAGSAFQVIRQLKDELTEDSVVVVLFHDHGSRYVGKIFNDDWMKEVGFM